MPKLMPENAGVFDIGRYNVAGTVTKKGCKALALVPGLFPHCEGESCRQKMIGTSISDLSPSLQFPFVHAVCGSEEWKPA